MNIPYVSIDNVDYMNFNRSDLEVHSDINDTFL